MVGTNPNDWWRKDFEAIVKKLESLINEDLDMRKIDYSVLRPQFTKLIIYLGLLKKPGNIINVNEPAKQQRDITAKGNPATSNAAISSTSNSSQLLSSSTNTKADLPGVAPSKPVDSFTNTANQLINSIPGINSTKAFLDKLRGPDGELPQKLRSLPPKLIERISNEIMDKDPNVCWDDIAGLHYAKKCVNEMVVWPLLRPDLFKGCRSPGRGLLLFGPPGTGKTMIGKAIAGEAKATFFNISSSSLSSKWLGDGENLVRALFGVASCYQPAVIFVDEIDSLLSKRKSEGEHVEHRRVKTQFLIEMEGCDSANDKVLLIGATNRPQDLDEAARRRLTKRLYIPLPCAEARAWIIENLLKKDELFKLSTENMDIICKLTEGNSGSDMKNLVHDASMGPLREALTQGIEITKLKKEDMRPVTLQDFKDSLQEMRPSVSLNELGAYEDWNNQFGSLSSSKTCVSSQQASGLSDEKVKDKPSSISSDSINRHRKKRKTSSLGEYKTLSDAQTCIDLDDDVSLITLRSRARSRTQSRTK